MINGDTLTEQERPNPAIGPSRRKIWPLTLAAVAVTIIIFALLRKGPGVSAPGGYAGSVPNIRTATAHRGNIGQYLEALGTVTPLATVNLYSQVTGQVIAVHYVEGQTVQRGDPLIDIDPRPYEAQLQQYQGQLERDQALLKQAELDLTRYKDASSQDAVPRQTYEDQVQMVEQYRGSIKNDTGQVQYGQIQLSYCHLTSTINGRVGLRLVDPGNTIFAGGNTPIVVITQLQPISVVFNVAEDNLDQLRAQITHRHALPVEAYDRARLARVATGKLLTLDNQVDTSTGTIRFRGEFDNTNLALFPNQFVNARLLVRTLQDQLLVPRSAVQHNGVQAFVYAVHSGAVQAQPVTEIATEGDDAAVSGLPDGTVVAITGFEKIQNGARVAVLNTPPSESTTGLHRDGAAR